MTEDLFSQRPRTLRGNKRIKRLSGPPAWRMMRQGKASPRETNQTIVWHSQTFSTVKPGEQEKRWKNSGWSYHLQNHVGMVSEDLIIGMELNFLKTKGKRRGRGGRKGKKRQRRKRKEKKKERKKERKMQDQEEGKTLLVRPKRNFSTHKTLRCYVWSPALENMRKASTGQGHRERTWSTNLTSVSAIYHPILGKNASIQTCSI